MGAGCVSSVDGPGLGGRQRSGWLWRTVLGYRDGWARRERHSLLAPTARASGNSIRRHVASGGLLVRQLQPLPLRLSFELHPGGSLERKRRLGWRLGPVVGRRRSEPGVCQAILAGRTGVPADGSRDVPDVSLTSAIHDGYMVALNGQFYVFGGTSAAAPACFTMWPREATRFPDRQASTRGPDMTPPAVLDRWTRACS